jgi:hypothetical protein
MLTLHKEDIQHEKNLYKKMLGQDKCPENLPKDKKVGVGLLHFGAVHFVPRFIAYRLYIEYIFI